MCFLRGQYESGEIEWYSEYQLWDIIMTYARRPTYVNRGDGRVSNHIPDVVHLPYGRCRRGCQHHFARHPRLFSTTASPRKTLLAQYALQVESEPQGFEMNKSRIALSQIFADKNFFLSIP